MPYGFQYRTFGWFERYCVGVLREAGRDEQQVAKVALSLAADKKRQALHPFTSPSKAVPTFYNTEGAGKSVGSLVQVERTAD